MHPVQQASPWRSHTPVATASMHVQDKGAVGHARGWGDTLYRYATSSVRRISAASTEIVTQRNEIDIGTVTL